MEKTAFLRKVSKATAALVAFAAVSGCGYNFKGAGLTAPAGVRTIAVTVLDNRTSESGIETVFTSDLAYEFTRSKALRVVDSKEADAILSGSIASMTVDTISHTGDYESDERRVTMTLDLALKRADGSVIWSDRAVSERETFEVSRSDKLETERERRVAIEAISKRLAEKVHNRILQDF
jgi:outer membrane lipopolysaccharide assembly protein LptE/RlpB